MLTIRELAEKLDGREYPFKLSDDELAEARRAGLVTAYGGSDDLIEFEGAINDESDCYGGGEFQIDRKGILPAFDNIDHDHAECKDFFEREARTAKIEAKFDNAGYTWTYVTDIPHATFEIMEDGEKYCRGIVFALDDLPI